MKKILAFAAASLAVVSLSADPQGEAVARQSFDLPKAKDTSLVATMTLIDKSGAKKVRKLEMFTRREGGQTSSLTRFLEPADVAGTKLLSVSQNGQEDQRLYLPALKKVRKIAASGKDGDFVNSDLSYYDLENREYEDNTYQLLAENETLAAFPGQVFAKVELRAKAKGTPYSKSIAWIDAANHFIYRLETYGQDGALWKVIQFTKVGTFDGVLLPLRTEVENKKRGSKTILEMTAPKVNTGLKASLFSEKTLEQ